jgi:hypothetical protein
VNGLPFLGLLALVLFLAFAASGVTWLIATVVPNTVPGGRREVGLVAMITAALLAVVLFAGALLAPQRPFRGGLFGPRPPVPGQQLPAQPPAPQSPQPTR